MRNVELQIEMMSCEPLLLRLDEVAQILRHRFIIVLVCVVTLPVVVEPALFLQRFNLSDIAFQLLYPAISVVLFFGQIWLVALLSKGKPRVRLHFTAIMAVAIIIPQLLLTEAYSALYSTYDAGALFRAVLLFFWNLLLAELARAFSVRFLMPTILKEIRSKKPGAGRVQLLRTNDEAPRVSAQNEEAVARDGSNPSHDMFPEGTEPEEAPQIFEWRDVSVPMHSLRTVQADGNYVTILAEEDSYFAQGPFRDVLACINPDIGVLVNRSLWVAFTEIVGARRERGELFLTLRDDTTIKVARPRQVQVSEVIGQQLPEVPLFS